MGGIDYSKTFALRCAPNGKAQAIINLIEEWKRQNLPANVCSSFPREARRKIIPSRVCFGETKKCDLSCLCLSFKTKVYQYATVNQH